VNPFRSSKTSKPWARVGIDFARDATRVVVAGRRARTLDLRGALCVAQDDAPSARTIAAWLDKMGVRGRAAAFCVSNSDVQEVPLEMPSMPEDDLALAVSHAVSREIGAPVGSLCIDHIARSAAGVASEKAALLGLAVGVSIVENMTKRVGALGLTPKVADLRSMALWRLVDHSHPWKKGMVVIAAEVQRENALLVFMRDGNCLFHREVPIDDGAEGLAGILAAVESSRAEGKAGGREKSPVERLSEQLATEIRRSLHYGEYNLALEEIEKIYVCGSGLPSGDIEASVHQSSRLECSVLDPLNDAEIPEDCLTLDGDEGPAFAIAAGLAIREDLS
jgi:Tfp pilus assembly PilM family ATPase